MKIQKLLYSIIVAFLPFSASAQMYFANPSFEGPTGTGITGAPWAICCGTPDTGPGPYGVDMAASNGNTYLGLWDGGPLVGSCAGGNGEGASEQLPCALRAGKTYTFTLDIAWDLNSPSTYTQGAILEIYGGMANCAKTSLLWSGSPTAAQVWQTKTVTFTPTSNWTHISFFAKSGTGSKFVLVDNLSPISRPATSVVSSNASCGGPGNDGTATVTPPADGTAWVYLWSNGQTTATATGLSPGSYTCRVSDPAEACPIPIFITVIIQGPPVVTVSATPATICAGQTSQLQALVPASTPPTCVYAINMFDTFGDGWTNPGRVEIRVNGVLVGTYTLASGSTGSGTFTVTQGDNIEVRYFTSSSWNDENRFEIRNASAALLYNSGTNPTAGIKWTGVANCGYVPPVYTYTWAPSGTLSNASIYNPVASPVVSTTYTVSVSSSTNPGCNATRTIAVTVNPSPNAVASAQTICSGLTTSIGITSGSAGTTFAWTASPSAGITGSSAGSGTPIAQTLTNSGTTPGTVTYTITPTGPAPSNCVGTPITVIATVNPKPIAAASPQTICSGQTTSIGITSGVAGTTFSWTASPSAGITGSSAGSGTPIAQTLTNSGTTPGTVTYTITPTGPAPSNCVGTPITVIATIDPKPNAVASPQTICSGTATSIGITSGIASTTFAWTASPSAGITGSSAGSGTPIAQTLTNSGTTPGTVTYTITPTGPAPSSCVGTPVTVVATVNPRPTAAASAQTICSGQTTSIGITSPTAGTTFSWTASASAGITGSSAGSGTPIAQTLSNSGTTPGTVTYTITPTGPAPSNCVGTAITVIANVNPTPNAVASSQTICSGTATSIGITSGVASTTFAWTASASAGITGSSAGSGTPIAQTLTNSGTTPGTVTYTITPTGPAPGSCVGTAITVIATVNPRPTASASAQTICSGQTTSIGITSPTAGTTFSWTASASAGITGSSAGSGTPIAQTLTNSGTTPGTVTYTITPTGPAPSLCVGTAITVVATVNPTPNAVASPQTICSGTATSIGITSGVAGTTFGWTASPSAGITGSSAGSGTPIAQTLTNSGTTPGTVTYTITPTGPAPSLCVGTAITVVATVNPTPNAVASPQTICSGTATSIGITSGVAGTTFGWTASPSAGITGSSAGSGTPIAQTLTNSGTTPGTVTYTITPTGPAPSLCVGTPVTLLVTVNPTPNALASPQTICSGQATNIAITSAVAGATFNWTASASAGITGSSAGSGSPIAQTLTNSGTTPGTVTYTITPTGPAPSNCPGAAITVIATVNPSPTASASPQTICSGQATSIGITSPTAGTTFSWTASPSAGITGSSAGSGTPIAQTLTNSGTTPGTVTYTITPTGPAPSSCPGPAITVVATVNPTPNAVASPQTICSGTATSIGITSGVASTTFAWTASPSAGITGSLAGSGSPIAQTLNNSGTTPGTVTYTITPTGPAPSSCPGPAITVIATINPIPNAVASPQAICSGQSTNIAITSAVAGASFSWTASASAGITGSSAGSGSPIAQTLNNSGTTPGTVTYTITPTGPAPSNCPGAPITVVVTVHPTPNAVASPQAICSGQTTSIAITSAVAGATFAWTASASAGIAGSSAGSGTPIAQTLTNTGTTPGTVTYTITPTGPAPSSCVGAAVTVIATVNPTPNAVASPQTICSGQTTSIAITSAVAGATFGWTASASAGITGSSAGSGTPIAQTLTNTGTSPGTVTYTITPTGPAPTNCPGTPVTVIVTVDPIPDAVASPQAICSGQTTNVAITSAVSGVSFSWTASASAGITGSSAGSGTPITQTLNNSGTTPGTVTYTITPMGPAPSSCPGTPITVIVTVNPAPNVIASPSSQIICSGQITGISLTSNVAGATFAWTASASAGISGFAAGSGSTIAQTLNNSGTVPGTVTYTITPTGSGSCPGVPLEVIITINPTPNAIASPQTICSGQSSNVGITSNVAGASFSWTAVSSAGITGSGPGSGSSITQVLTNSSLVPGTVTYTITPAGPAPSNCPGAAITVVVTINPSPDAIASPQTICSGQATNIAISSGVAGATFSWTASASAGITGSSAGSGTPITQTLTNTGTTDGTVTYTITPTGPAPSLCPGTPVNVIVTVSPIPNVSGSPQIICSGNTTAVVLSSNIVGTVFNWTANPSAGITGSSAGSGTPIAQVLSNTGTSPGTVTYTITPTGPAPGNCIGTAVNIIVTVDPIPNAIASPQSICSGTISNVGITSNVSGAGFSWTASAPGSISGYSGGSGNIISQTLTNTSNTPANVTYTITPTGPAPASCPGPSITVEVTVNPLPDVIASPSSQTICSSESTNIDLTSNVPGSSFSWTALSSAGITGSGAGSGINIAQALTNASNTLAGTVTYTITPTGPAPTNCPGIPVAAIVTINPTPLPPTVTDVMYCKNDPSSPLSATGSNLIWEDNAGTILPGAPTPSTAVATTIIYKVRQELNGCESPQAIITVTVNDLPPAPVVSSPAPYCQGDVIAPIVCNPVFGGTIKWFTNSSLTGIPIFTGTSYTPAASNGSYWVAEISPAGCAGPAVQIDIIVNPKDDPAFSYGSSTYCKTGSDPSPTITSPGGIFTYTAATAGNLLIINTSTGEIDLSASNLDTYTIKYVTGGICPDSSTVMLTITSAPDASFTYNGPYCEGGSPNPLPNFLSGASAGVFSSLPSLTSAQLDQNTGEIDLAITPAGTYDITNTIAAGGGCAADIHSETVVINPRPTVTATPLTATICSGTAPSIILTGTPAGVIFDWTVSNINGSITGSSSGSGVAIAQILNSLDNAPGSVSYEITPSISGSSCLGIPVTVVITVNPVPAAPVTNPSGPYCQGDIASTLSAIPSAGGALNWYPGGSTAPTPSTAVAGTILYEVSQTIDGCEGPKASIAVTVNPVPAAPTAPDAAYCEGAAVADLTAGPGIGGSFKWYSDAATINQVGVGSPFSSGAIVTTTFYVNETKSGCTGPATEVVITINPKDDASFNYPSATFCLTGTDPIPTITGLAGGIFTATAPGVINASSGMVDISATGLSTFNVTYTTNGTCPNSSQVTITITDAPSADFSYAGPYCNYGPNPLPIITPPNSAGTFSAAPLGLALTLNTGEIDLAASTPGTYTITNTIAAAGGCAAATANAVVIINPSPAAPVTGSVNYCENAVAVPLNAVGSNLLWYDDLIDISGDPLAPTPSTTPTGTKRYYVSQTVTGCEGPRSFVTVNIDPIPTAPVVISPAPYCAGDPIAALTATGSGGTLNWYNALPIIPANLVGPNTATFNSGATATSTFYVTETSSGCSSNPTAVVITINPLDDPGFNYSSSTFCKSAGGTQSPTIARPGGTFIYTLASGGPTLAINAAGVIDISASDEGSYDITYTTNGPCPGTSSITVNIVNLPLAGFNYSGPYCKSGTAVPVYTSGASAGTFTSVGLTGLNPANGVIDLTLAPTGTYTVTNTISGAGCPTVAATATVVINTTPAAPSVSNLVYCKGVAAPALTPSGTGYTWYNGSGPTATPIPTPTPNTAVVSAPLGTNYYVSQSVAGCEGPRATLNVIVNDVPTPPTAPTPIEYCKDALAIPLTATGTALKWYDVSAGGIDLGGAPTPNTGVVITTTKNYWVSQTLSSCESPRFKIVTTVYVAPAPVTTNPPAYCQNEVLTADDTLKATGTNIKWYDAITGGTWLFPTPIPLTSATGITTYYASQTLNGCEGLRSPYVVTVTAPLAPTPNAAGPYCKGALANALSANVNPAGNTLLWYDASNVLIGPTAPVPSTSIGNITLTYYVSQKTAAGCEGPKAIITVIINETNPPTTVPVTYCQNDPSSPLVVAGTDIKWFINASSTSTIPAPTVNTSIDGVQTFYVEDWGVTGCKSDRMPLVVTVNDSPDEPQVPPVWACDSLPAVLDVSPVLAGTYSWYDVFSGGSAIQSGSSIFFIPMVTGDSTVYVELQNSFGCKSPRAIGVLTMNPKPAPPVVTSPSKCFGQDADINIVDMGYNYAWYTNLIGGTLLWPEQQHTILAPAVGTYTYYAEVTSVPANGPGCVSRRTAASFTIFANPNDPIASDNSVCLGYPHPVLQASSSSTGSIVWYADTLAGPIYTGTSYDPVPSFNLYSDTTYFIRVENGVCNSGMVPISATVRPLNVPQMQVNTSAPDGICPGLGIDFGIQDTLNNGTGPYIWYVNDVMVGSAGTVYSSSALNNGDEVKCVHTITGGVDCPSPAYVADSVLAVIHPLPSDTINPSIDRGCEPLSVSFSQNADNTYAWDFGNGSSTQSNPLQVFTYLEAPGGDGKYNVKLTVTNILTTCQNIVYKQIEAYEKAHASFTYGPDDISNLSPEVYFEDLSSPLGKLDRWAWDFGDGSLDSVQHPQHTYAKEGAYTVSLKVTTIQGCKDSTTRPLSVMDNYTFYVPNAFSPNGDGVNDEFGGKGMGIIGYEMYIYNRWGEEIYSTKDMTKPWNGKDKGTGAAVQVDVYVYKIIVTDFQYKKRPYVGKINLIR